MSLFFPYKLHLINALERGLPVLRVAHFAIHVVDPCGSLRTEYRVNSTAFGYSLSGRITSTFQKRL
jgi:hypothetical protein